MVDLKDFTENYAPAPEVVEHINLKESYQLFINGEFRPPESGKTLTTINPATEEKLAEVAFANEKDVNKAVKSARDAYTNIWSQLPPKERGKYIYRIARTIQERSREFAIIESLDGGKPIRESRYPLSGSPFFLLCWLG